MTKVWIVFPPGVDASTADWQLHQAALVSRTFGPWQSDDGHAILIAVPQDTDHGFCDRVPSMLPGALSFDAPNAPLGVNYTHFSYIDPSIGASSTLAQAMELLCQNFGVPTIYEP